MDERWELVHAKRIDQTRSLEKARKDVVRQYYYSGRERRRGSCRAWHWFGRSLTRLTLPHWNLRLEVFCLPLALASSKPASVAIGYWVGIGRGILVGQRIQIFDIGHASHLLDRLIDKCRIEGWRTILAFA